MTLGESEERFTLLVGGLKEHALYMLDCEGRINSWNEGAQRIKQYSPEEILGKNFELFFTEVDRRRGHPHHLLEVAAQNGMVEEEAWRVRKDGSRFWASIVLTALRSADGSLLGFAKVTRDETIRFEAVTKLRESEERFSLLVGGLKEHALYMLDGDGVVNSWNEGAQRIKHYRADEIIGRNFEIFFTGEDRQAGRPRQILEIAARVGMFAEEGWRVRKDGSRFWASIVLTALRTGDGSLIGFAKVTRDETDRHEAGIVLQKTMEDLRASEAQLAVQAQKLRRVNDELKQFNYIASHDLQEPLRLIITFCEKITEKIANASDQETLDDFRLVMDAARRMRQLIHDLLSFGSAQSQARLPVEIPLKEVLEEALLNLRVALAEGGATVESDALPIVVADQRLMTQVLQNLIGNALKYRSDAAPMIRISAQRVDDAWQITVGDNGLGIAERHHQRIFQLFKKMHTKPSHSGMGLGLALCKLIVERHGGRIWVESLPPAPGSRFIFTIPDQIPMDPSSAGGVERDGAI